VNFCREKMADNKKEMVPTKKSNLSPESKPFELVTPSQLSSRDLVPRSPSIQLVNRFTTLGSTLSLRPTFQSALVSPSHYDPFESIKPQRAPRSFPKTSPYFTKLPSHNLFFIEPDFSHLKSPEEIAKAYFPPRWHFPTIHPDKPIEFLYKYIYHGLLDCLSKNILLIISYALRRQEKNAFLV
jgi:hypothetical protein